LQPIVTGGIGSSVLLKVAADNSCRGPINFF
jgi:hypothetical protein